MKSPRPGPGDAGDGLAELHRMAAEQAADTSPHDWPAGDSFSAAPPAGGGWLAGSDDTGRYADGADWAADEPGDWPGGQGASGGDGSPGGYGSSGFYGADVDHGDAGGHGAGDDYGSSGGYGAGSGYEDAGRRWAADEAYDRAFVSDPARGSGAPPWSGSSGGYGAGGGDGDAHGWAGDEPDDRAERAGLLVALAGRLSAWWRSAVHRPVTATTAAAAAVIVTAAVLAVVLAINSPGSLRRGPVSDALRRAIPDRSAESSGPGVQLPGGTTGNRPAGGQPGTPSGPVPRPVGALPPPGSPAQPPAPIVSPSVSAPVPTSTPVPSPVPTGKPSPSPTPSPDPSPSPSPSPSPTPDPSPSPSPDPSPSSPAPTSSPAPSPSETPSATPTSSPAAG